MWRYICFHRGRKGISVWQKNFLLIGKFWALNKAGFALGIINSALKTCLLFPLDSLITHSFYLFILLCSSFLSSLTTSARWKQLNTACYNCLFSVPLLSNQNSSLSTNESLLFFTLLWLAHIISDWLPFRLVFSTALTTLSRPGFSERSTINGDILRSSLSSNHSVQRFRCSVSVKVQFPSCSAQLFTSVCFPSLLLFGCFHSMYFLPFLWT